jgi:hypothetical protein
MVGIELRQKLMNVAEVIDAWRVFPRIFLIMYISILWHGHEWFTDLKTPIQLQYDYINLLWLAAGGITAWYLSTGFKWHLRG